MIPDITAFVCAYVEAIDRDDADGISAFNTYRDACHAVGFKTGVVIGDVTLRLPLTRAECEAYVADREYLAEHAP